MRVCLNGKYRAGVKTSCVLLSSGKTTMDIAVESTNENNERSHAQICLSASQIDALISILQAIQKEQNEDKGN